LLLPHLKKFSTKLVQNLPNEVGSLQEHCWVFPASEANSKSIASIHHECRFGS